MMTFSLKKDFTIFRAETGEYMLYTPYKKYYIPKVFYDIIILLQKGYAVEEIQNKLNEEIGEEKVKKIIEESFFRMGIICGTSYEREKKKNSLIWKKDLMEPVWLYHEKMISFFYNKFFVVLFITAYLSIYGYGLYHWGGMEVLESDYFDINQGIIAGIYLVLFFFSSCIHELGHYLTSVWLGAKPGKIGIGIYLITPVLYTSLDDVWRLSPQKRNIVNIAGIYFQSIFLLFLAVFALIMQEKTSFFICFIGTIGIFVNLIPFIRLDGYWIMNDYLETNHLMDRSIHYFLGLFGVEKRRNYYVSKNKFKENLFKLYSILLVVFLMVYSVMFVKIFYTNSIILYRIFTEGRVNFNILWLLLRSFFIIIIFINIISIIRGMIKRHL